LTDNNERDWDDKTLKLVACLEALLELDRERAPVAEAPPSDLHNRPSRVVAARFQPE
jgi:hypothetical protein